MSENKTLLPPKVAYAVTLPLVTPVPWMFSAVGAIGVTRGVQQSAIGTCVIGCVIIVATIVASGAFLLWLASELGCVRSLKASKLSGALIARTFVVGVAFHAIPLVAAITLPNSVVFLSLAAVWALCILYLLVLALVRFVIEVIKGRSMS